MGAIPSSGPSPSRQENIARQATLNAATFNPTEEWGDLPEFPEYFRSSYDKFEGCIFPAILTKMQVGKFNSLDFTLSVNYKFREHAIPLLGAEKRIVVVGVKPWNITR